MPRQVSCNKCYVNVNKLTGAKGRFFHIFILVFQVHKMYSVIFSSQKSSFNFNFIRVILVYLVLIYSFILVNYNNLAWNQINKLEDAPNGRGEFRDE